MNRFDPERSQITLFLNLFQWQVIRCGIETYDSVTHLLALLLVEIAESILGKPTDKIVDFEHVK